MEVKGIIKLIDTTENKQVIARAITKEILNSYELTEFPDMEPWLTEEMVKHPLSELIFANNAFITLLAERCAYDIGVFMVVGLIEEGTFHESLKPIYAFINKVCKEFGIPCTKLLTMGSKKFAKVKGETIITNEDVAAELMTPIVMGYTKSPKVPSIVAWAMAEAGEDNPRRRKPRHKRVN